MRYLATCFCFVALLWLSGIGGPLAADAESATVSVKTWRLPAGGIQPQAATDSKGAVHIIYFVAASSDGVGNIFYVRLDPGQTRPTQAIRVNSTPDTASCIGTVRTAQIAIGKGSRIHVVWNGLGPIGSNGYHTAYQAYARLNDTVRAFEPQRNIITWAAGVDGGGSVAADSEGRVYVVWHALAGAKNEAGRAVYIARSNDDGATFSREVRANPDPTGACGCCGLRALADHSGNLYVLYRTATNSVNRDTTLLVSRDQGQTFTQRKLHEWNINACPMSTYALTETKDGVVAAWETMGRIYFSAINASSMDVTKPTVVPGSDQKHPFLTETPNGDVLLTWAEGTGWQKGGAMAWQVISKDGSLLSSGREANAIPTWGLDTAYAKPDGSFVIVY